ncbi:hypothetical protein [Yersinia ruckeri]|uniref:hypothetical protein n=1 Tax=Yersinia ruckeri TaxID=29486 RepID=UPI002237EB98|nr:hypothetical protein [Yersinia ruckeri]MCW6598830.1 hypothetical protein [Yersinia ruckeri]
MTIRKQMHPKKSENIRLCKINLQSKLDNKDVLISFEKTSASAYLDFEFEEQINHFNNPSRNPDLRETIIAKFEALISELQPKVGTILNIKGDLNTFDTAYTLA